ncbi:MAG: RecX family transcriptional regulator [Candidatus Krumholzibacteriota bacterium]|nr:RecX family transcriptional regulator [Candidatus Krumholzibacteriota bacterium]
MPARAADSDPRARVLRWLARRDRSERELRERLAAWGVPAAEGEAILGELKERGLVDDAALAGRIRDWHCRHDPVGPRGLRERLRRRGLPDDLAAAACAPLRDADIQRELADAVLRRRLPALRALDPARRRRRLAAHLERRGFDGDLIRAALAELEDGDTEAEDATPC